MLLAQVSVIDLVVLLIVGVFLVVILAAIARHAALWFQAYMTGVPLSLFQIIEMRFRKIDPTTVVRTLIITKQAGIKLECDEVERACLQGADLMKISRALVRAKREGLEMSFQDLVDADLDGSLGQDLRE